VKTRRGARVVLALGGQRVVDVRVGGHGRHGARDRARVRADAPSRLRLDDREAEMSSIARVIFLVVWAERIFCR
jgi:hypothetical protein